MHADLYQWTDTQGITYVVDDVTAVPPAYRNQVVVYRSAKPAAPANTLLLSPSREYPARSQGAFAQKLAADLGLIKSGEDALGPLGGIGIHPAGGWRVSDPLTDEDINEVSDAARRAVGNQRLSLSAAGAETTVRQLAKAFSPPEEKLPPAAPPRQVIIPQVPPQVVKVERESVREIIVRAPVHIPSRAILPRPSPARLRLPQPPDNAADPAPTQPTHLPFGTSHMPFGEAHLPSPVNVR